MMNKINWKKLISCILIVFFIWILSNIIINKFSIIYFKHIFDNPLRFILPLITYLILSLALYFAWINSTENKTRNKVFILFGIYFLIFIISSLFMFMDFSGIFYYLQLIYLGYMIYSLFKINKISGYLLLSLFIISILYSIFQAYAYGA